MSDDEKKKPAPEETPAEREVTGADIAFEWVGETFTLPGSADEWDIKVLRAAEAGANLQSLELIFGDDFGRLEAAHRKAHDGKFTAGQLEELASKVFGLYGVPQGN